MNRLDNCPNCNNSLIGDPIPKEIVEHYLGTHWKREIGIDGGWARIYDRIVAWRCPDCNHEWSRGNSEWAKEMFEKYQNLKRNDNKEV